MTFSDIQAAWEQDCHIDKSDTDGELAKIGKLLYKYSNILYEETIRFRRLQDVHIRNHDLLRLYYQGKCDPQQLKELGDRINYAGRRPLKEDLKIMIEADPLFQTSQMKVTQQEAKLQYIETIIKHLHTRGYNIKTMFDFMVFTGGMA